MRVVWQWVVQRFHVKHGPLPRDGGGAWGLDGLLGATGRTELGHFVEVHGTVLFELQVVAQCTSYDKALVLKRMAKRESVRVALRAMRPQARPAGLVTAEHVAIVTVEVGVNRNGTLVNGGMRLSAELLAAAALADAAPGKVDKVEPVAQVGWDAGTFKAAAPPPRIRTSSPRTVEPEPARTKRVKVDPAAVLAGIDDLSEVKGQKGVVLFQHYVAMRWGDCAARRKLSIKADTCCDDWGWTLGEELYELQLNRGGSPALVCSRRKLRKAHKKEHKL